MFFVGKALLLGELKGKMPSKNLCPAAGGKAVMGAGARTGVHQRCHGPSLELAAGAEGAILIDIKKYRDNFEIAVS